MTDDANSIEVPASQSERQNMALDEGLRVKNALLLIFESVDKAANACDRDAQAEIAEPLWAAIWAIRQITPSLNRMFACIDVTPFGMTDNEGGALRPEAPGEQSGDHVTGIVRMACQIIAADDPSITDLLIARHWLQAAINQPGDQDVPEHLESLDIQLLELLGTVQPRTSSEAHNLLRLVRKELRAGEMDFMDGAIGNATSFLEQHERVPA